MKCPNCNKQPISKLQFSLTSFPSNIHCMHCDAELKPSSLIQSMIYGEYLLGGILGFALVLLSGYYGWSFIDATVIFFIVVIIIALPMLFYVWKNGKYELVKKP